MGITVSLFVMHGARKGGAAILLLWQMALAIFGPTLLLCAIAAAVLSLLRNEMSTFLGRLAASMHYPQDRGYGLVLNR